MDYCTPVEQDAWPVSYKNEFEYSFSGETDMADTQVAIYDYERADEHIITVVFRGSELPDFFNNDRLGLLAYIKKLTHQLPSFFKGTSNASSPPIRALPTPRCPQYLVYRPRPARPFCCPFPSRARVATYTLDYMHLFVLYLLTPTLRSLLHHTEPLPARHKIGSEAISTSGQPRTSCAGQARNWASSFTRASSTAGWPFETKLRRRS